jgi:hypothetical protein
MEKVYASIPEDERPMMLMNTEVTEENVEMYLGTSDIEFEEALASESGVGSIAHSVVLVRVKDNANVELIKEKIENSVNPRKWICVGVEKEDVSNNSIIHENRLIEKPKIFYSHIAGYSPYIFPKENLDFIERQVDTFEQTGKLPENLPMAEWVYTDGINQFLDSVPEGAYALKMFMKSEKDLLIDTGTLPLYELAQVRALLTLSRFKEDNKKLARELLND